MGVAVLSDCAHALESLLYPFAWQHIYVPILVPKMIDYVCAPMPFLIGALMCVGGFLSVC